MAIEGFGQFEKPVSGGTHREKTPIEEAESKVWTAYEKLERAFDDKTDLPSLAYIATLAEEYQAATRLLDLLKQS